MKSPLRRRVAPSVPFTLDYWDVDGTKHSDSFLLSYNLNTLALVEEALGKSMLLDIGEILDNPSVKNVSVLLWAAIQENHPDYEGHEGLQTVRYNLTIATAKAAQDACTKAFLAQLPPDQVKRIEEQMAGAPPLVESPAPATV